MRYVSEDYYIMALLRMGELTAYQTRNSFLRMRHLDPAAIGKAIQQVAHRRMTFGKGLGFVEELRDWKYIVEAIGAVGPRELERNSARIHITSDGSEVSFSVYGPELSSDHRNWVEVMPVLSAKTTTSWEIRKEGELQGMDVETLESALTASPLMIAPWKDPEMLGYAVLECFKKVGPPARKGLESVFDPLPPKRRGALHRAARDADFAGLPPRGRRTRRKLDVHDSVGATPLMLAAQNGHADVVEILLELGASADALDEEERTALHYGARNGSGAVVSALLAAGASTSIADAYGQTPLHAAAEAKNENAARLLLGAGAVPDTPDHIFDSTPLHLAVRCSRTGMVRLLLECGADIDARNEGGRSALHVAAGYGHTETVKALLAAGADANLRDARGETPLHRPAYFQHLDCISALVEGGADLNAADEDGNTPLHIAASMNRDRAAAVLLGAGADLEAVNAEGLTPLDLATISYHRIGYRERNSESVLLLLGRGATLIPECLPLLERHHLWPHLTPSDLLDDYGDLDYEKIPQLREVPEEHRCWYGQHRISQRFEWDHTFDTLLQEAYRKEMPELMERLLDMGVCIDPVLLFEGIWGDDLKLVKMLLERGVGIECSWTGPNFRGEYGLHVMGRLHDQMGTALDTAVSNGKVDAARFLLSKGARPFPPGIYEEGREKLKAIRARLYREFESKYPERNDESDYDRRHYRTNADKQRQAKHGLDDYIQRYIDTGRLMQNDDSLYIDLCPRENFKEMERVFEEFGLPTRKSFPSQ
ncbi:MAG: ankyrin repeat domain-containing protein [Chloroflexota bacterium]|nr:ankyrin repeat domain-containing protein [Chloroflexota bacterium]